MGRAACEALVQKGYTVFGLDYQEADPPSGIEWIRCDVRDAASVARAIEQIRQRTDHLDAMIHTAGIYDLDSLVEMDEERFTRILNINLFGVYRINKAGIPLLKTGGRILIITSELAPLDPLPFTGIYAISKAALEKYAYSLRMEVNLLGISVSVIRPGAVNTRLLGDSVRALDRFCDNTRLYPCNAGKFRQIVNSVEARSVSPAVVAKTIGRAIESARPRYVYNINRNILLRLLNVLPARLQTAIIRQILKP